MRNWNKEFNELPRGIRTIGCAVDIITRINQMEIDKKRIKKSCKNACAEIDSHIKNCKDGLARLEKEDQWNTK